MRSITEQFKNDSSQVLDRLVDGELSESERREVLTLLDDEPGGWRACALAFVEAQTWRGDLQAVAIEAESMPLFGTVSAGSPATVVRAFSAPMRLVGRYNPAGLLALCASLLLSLAIGWQLAMFAHTRPVAHQNGEQSTPVVRQPERRLAARSSVDLQFPPDEDSATETNPPSRLGSVQLSIDDPAAGEMLPVNLPVTEVDAIDPQWLASQQSALPAHVLEELERAGHRVTRHQEFWPIHMQDGRQLILPVEQLEVQFARSYQ